MAERDLAHGRLDEDKHREMLVCIHEMVEMAWEQSIQKLADTDSDEQPEGRVRRAVPTTCDVCVMCLPARGRADEIASLMTAQILVEAGIPAKYQAVAALAGEMLDAVETEKQQVVVISALPPEAVTHARYLVKRARARPGWADRSIVVGLWGVSAANVDKALGRIQTSGTEDVVTNFVQAKERLRQIVQSIVLTDSRKPVAEDQDVPQAPTTREVPAAREVVKGNGEAAVAVTAAAAAAAKVAEKK
jgi:methylmalonyl-CoA mutase cobalamin-binding subunit